MAEPDLVEPAITSGIAALSVTSPITSTHVVDTSDVNDIFYFRYYNPGDRSCSFALSALPTIPDLSFSSTPIALTAVVWYYLF